MASKKVQSSSEIFLGLAVKELDDALSILRHECTHNMGTEYAVVERKTVAEAMDKIAVAQELARAVKVVARTKREEEAEKEAV